MVYRISIDLNEKEMEAIRKYFPMFDTMKALFPQELLSVVHKVEKAIKE